MSAVNQSSNLNKANFIDLIYLIKASCEAAMDSTSPDLQESYAGKALTLATKLCQSLSFLAANEQNADIFQRLELRIHATSEEMLLDMLSRLPATHSDQARQNYIDNIRLLLVQAQSDCAQFLKFTAANDPTDLGLMADFACIISDSLTTISSCFFMLNQEPELTAFRARQSKGMPKP